MAEVGGGTDRERERGVARPRLRQSDNAPPTKKGRQPKQLLFIPN